jgi:hypothetical protein
MSPRSPGSNPATDAAKAKVMRVVQALRRRLRNALRRLKGG